MTRCRSDIGPPGHISLVKRGPQGGGGLIALVFWGSPSEIGPFTRLRLKKIEKLRDAVEYLQNAIYPPGDN